MPTHEWRTLAGGMVFPTRSPGLDLAVLQNQTNRSCVSPAHASVIAGQALEPLTS